MSMRARILTGGAMALMTVALAEGAQAADDASAAPAEERTPVLDLRTGPWRTFITYGTPDLVDSAGKRVVLMTRGRAPKPVPVTTTEAPADGWTVPAYDDSAWRRERSPVGRGQRLRDSIWNENGAAWPKVIFARGKFEVTDPATVGDMRLSLRYQGGAVVSVNGKEVKRTHLPAGPINADTRADRYPREAYIRPDGKQLTPGNNKEFGHDSRDFADRFAMRVRTLEATVPASLLRKGVNVLAVAIHRAPYDELVVKTPFSKRNWRGSNGPWAHARLLDARLTAAPGAGVVPNVGRPAGLQVWTALPFETITRGSYADPCESLRPLRIAAARNGAYTGQIVVGGHETIEGLKVTAGDLVSKAGGRIAAAQVHIRYPLIAGRTYDPLATTAPEKVQAGTYRIGRKGPVEKAAVQPLWVTVAVPADAKPGEYGGAVSVEAKGLSPVSVPVAVTVHDWRLPDPKDYLTVTNIWQSWDSVALRYKVPLWSDRHWALMGKSVALTKPLANKFCEAHLITRGMDIGNSESLVRWIDKGGPSTGAGRAAYEYDFTNFDRYLDLYAKHVGKPLVLLIDVWRWAADRDNKAPGGFRTTGANPAKVSRLDPKTGAVEEMDQPLYGSPASLAFWKPVLTEVRKRLEARGWMDVACLGTGSDDHPRPPTLAVFREIWPDVPWFSTGHVRPSSYKAGKDARVRVRCREWVWGAGRLWSPGSRPYPQPWTSLPGNISMAFPREGSGAALVKQGSSLAVYRFNPERTLQSGLHGIGRVGADWWYVPGRRRPLCGLGGQYNFSASIMWFFHPGPDGAEPTVRSEMFREGVQTREAMQFLQKAVTEGRATGDLAKRCDALIRDRGRNQVSPIGRRHWLRDENRLLALCAEVAGETAPAESRGG